MNKVKDELFKEMYGSDSEDELNDWEFWNNEEQAKQAKGKKKKEDENKKTNFPKKKPKESLGTKEKPINLSKSGESDSISDLPPSFQSF